MTYLDTAGDDDSGAEYNALMAQPKSTLAEMVIAQHTEIVTLQRELAAAQKQAVEIEEAR